MLTYNSTYPIGLDISELSLKLVQLNKSGEKIRVQALGKIDLPDGCFQNGEIKNRQAVLGALKKLIANPKFGKITSEEVIACLPETRTFVKLIEVERADNLEEAVKLELEKHVPMAMDEIFFDWQVMAELPDRFFILAGAAPKAIVNQYTDFLKEARLSVVALEIEPISLCRSLLNEEHPKFKGKYEKNYGIIDIGAKRTNMTIYSKNTILFTISIPISGEEITKNIAEALEIEESQAEKAKIICGLDEKKAQGVIKNILSGEIEDLNKKIGEAIDFYENHFPGRGPLDKIILCGGGANIKNLDKIINKAVSIGTTMGDDLINLGEAKEKFSKILEETHSLNLDLTGKKEKKKPITITQDSSLSFATAIGLALRGVFIDEL